jgi:hypothetical protein
MSCSCILTSNDDVARVVNSVLAGAPIADCKRLLRDAQKSIVDSSVACWPNPSTAKCLYWLQVYVELAQAIKDDLLQANNDDSIKINAVFHSEAGINLSQSAVDSEIYSPFLQYLSDKKPPLLTAELSAQATPPLVRFWVQDEKLKSDWEALDVSEYQHYLSATPIFDNDRRSGEFLHIAYPGRPTGLSKYVGPAGVYLFLSARGVALPTCLVAKLTGLIQSLVTAQLWRVSQLLVGDIKSLARPFATVRGHLDTLTKAATTLAQRLDILERDTSALDVARRGARPLLELRGSAPDHKAVCHEYSQIAVSWATEAARIVARLGHFRVSLSDNHALTRMVASIMPSDFTTLSNAEEGWLIARAIYKCRLPLRLLNSKAKTYEVVVPPTGRHLQKAFPNKTGLQITLDRWMTLAVVELAEWQAAEKYQISVDQSMDGVYALHITHSSSLEPVYKAALQYIDGARDRDDLGGDNAQPWARVIRGLSGSADPQEVAQLQTDAPCTLCIRLRIDDFRKDNL